MGKNIIICCDGTGNEYGKENTNVVKTYEIVNKDDNQIAYYDPGVGTGAFALTAAMRTIKNTFSAATGKGLQKNIEQAYLYLMDHYETGDKIFLFGFSRGAFTVRALAGMLYKCGLLEKEGEYDIKHAAEVYNTHGNKAAATALKNASRPCSVHFIGVWDTVKALLLTENAKFHDANLNPDIGFGYHALSIDERRKRFRPNLWNTKVKHVNQTIEQVWFAGVHSDVGGSYKEAGLSNIALHWMLEKATEQDLLVDEEKLKKFPPNHLDIMHDECKKLFTRILFRKQEREIPSPAFIHHSVLARKRDTHNFIPKPYNPTNIP